MAAITTNDPTLQYTTATDPSIAASSVGKTQDANQKITPNGNLSDAWSVIANYAQSISPSNNRADQPVIDAPTNSSNSTISSNLEAGQYDLMKLLSDLSNNMMKNIQLDINNGLADRKRAADEIVKKLNDAIHKMERARKKQRSRNILSIITDVCMCVGAALAVAGAVALSTVTFSAAAPLVVITSLMLMQTVAGVISKHTGGPDMSISGAVTLLSLEILKGFGMSDEQAKKFAPIMAIGLTLVFMAAAAASGNPMAAITPLLTSPDLFGNSVASIAQQSGASEEDAMYIGMAVTFGCALVGAALMGVQAGKASQIALEGKNMAFAAQLGLKASQAGILVGLVSSGTTIGSSSLNISAAEDEKRAAYAQASVHKINALIQKIMQMMADNKDDVQSLISQSPNLLDGMAKTVKERSAVTQQLIGQMA